MEECSHPRVLGGPVEQIYCLKRIEAEHKEMEGADSETPSLQSAKSDKDRKRQSQSEGTSESWIVALAACLFHTLTSLGAATTGVYMVELVDYFNTGEAEVSWIGAIQLSLGGLGCIVIGGLVARIGSPRTAVLGTLLASGGQIAASFCNTIPALCVTLGFIVGLGGSCWIFSCIVAVQSFYVHRRSLASSVMTVGTSIGVVVFPVWTEYLMRVFNWRGALLINAAVALHGIPLAMLLRLGLKGKSCRETITAEQQGFERSDTSGQVSITDGISVNSPSAIKSHNELALRVKAMKLEQAPLNQSNDKCCTPDPEGEDDDDVLLPSPEQKDEVNTTKNIVHCMKSDGIPNENHRLDKTNHKTEEQTELERDTENGSNRSIYMELFHMSEVVLYILSAGCINFGHVVAVTFLPTRAVSLGISKELAATLVSVIGIIGPVARLGSGYLGDVFSKHRLVMYALSGTLTGTASILSAFAFNYTSLVVYGIGFALLSGCYVSFLSTVMTDLAGVKRLPQALSLLLPFVGLLVLVSVTTSGMLVDLTKSADVAFIYCGSIQTLGGVISAIIVFIQKKGIDRQKPAGKNITVA